MLARAAHRMGVDAIPNPHTDRLERIEALARAATPGRGRTGRPDGGDRPVAPRPHTPPVKAVRALSGDGVWRWEYEACWTPESW